VGVKLHPDLVYGNLYYWLLDDSQIVRGGATIALPEASARFGDHPNEPVIAGEMMREAELARWEKE
jgi:hypothetical protein